MGDASQVDLLSRIAQLELELHEAKKQLQSNGVADAEDSTDRYHGIDGLQSKEVAGLSSLHNLILLSDSALPLGSFAYSNGLESFLAHHKPLPPGQTLLSLFNKFLRLSVQSVVYTNVPYVLKGYREPSRILDLDNDLDASTPCKVTRAASVNQGRALLGIWEKSLHSGAAISFPTQEKARVELKAFSDGLKSSELSKPKWPVNGHLAPLWGTVCLALGQPEQDTAYLFVFNHAKAVVSAAIRANVLGPYSAQTVLASPDLQELIQHCLTKAWMVEPEDASQVVPVMDLWIGRHELLYSRIFNS